jgi:serine protease Do
MNKFASYAALFGAGFACCALIVRLGPVPFAPWTGGSSSVADAVARLEPAVVNIEVADGEGASRAVSLGSPSLPHPFDGAGSGVIIRSDGTVVTNYHVIAPALPKVKRGQTTNAIRVHFADGRTFERTQIIGWDKATDLAVLRLVPQKPTDFPVAPLGDSDTVRTGDYAIAVGNPLGFNSSVSLGIISAVHRRGFRSGPGQTLDSVIQTDAAINPGSSGGALADSTGRVVGITNAIATATGANVGVGFAIPINEAKPVMEALIQNGRVVRPYLGVVFVPVWAIEPRGLPKGVTIPKDYGAVLAGNKTSPAVLPQSPAQKAGLRPFDVLRRVDNQIVGDTRELPRLIARHKAGDNLPLTVWRNGKTFDITVRLEALPEPMDSKNGEGERPGTIPEWLPSP